MFLLVPQPDCITINQTRSDFSIKSNGFQTNNNSGGNSFDIDFIPISQRQNDLRIPPSGSFDPSGNTLDYKALRMSLWFDNMSTQLNSVVVQCAPHIVLQLVIRAPMETDKATIIS